MASDSSIPANRSLDLLRFLQGVTALRQKRITKYSEDADRLLYFGELPHDDKHIKSPFITPPTNTNDSPAWLVVQKAKMPPPPSVPAELKNWVEENTVADPTTEPQLLEEISLLEQQADDDEEEVITLRLEDHPEIALLWDDYLEKAWRPWAIQRKHWEKVQDVYTRLDEMRREQEEGGERYELLLAFGLLRWQTDQESIERHLFVAPAEISLNATRGRLTVEPAGSFERFRLETDMLPVAEAPTLDVDNEVHALDIAAWSKEHVAPLLRNVANAWRADAQADADEMTPRGPLPRVPRISFAPSLVLRKRRTSAYSDVLKQLLNSLESDASATAAPWDVLLAEGTTPALNDQGHQDEPCPISGDYHFPLPTNDEQREILDRLRMSVGVLVKGPPGTGKSHTIANLICHLLSEGHRVLVTAHAPKALAVLRGLLPTEVQNLCVTTMGGSREDQKLLEDGVSTILAKHATWPSPSAVGTKISDLEHRLTGMRRERGITEQRLLKCREAETQSLALPGGYEGTRGTVARRVAANAERFSWFPFANLVANECPLDSASIRRIAQASEVFPDELVSHIQKHLGTLDLPSPSDFAKLCSSLAEAKQVAGEAHARNAMLTKETDATLQELLACLSAIQSHAALGERMLGPTAEQIVVDVLTQQRDKWLHLCSQSESLLADHRDWVEAISGRHFELPALSAPAMAGLSDSIERRHEHFAKGGRRGVWIFAPRVVRDTAAVEDKCRVNGRPIRTPQDLAALCAYVRLRKAVGLLEQSWPIRVAHDAPTAQVISAWNDNVVAARKLVDDVSALVAKWSAAGGQRFREAISSSSSRLAWLNAVELEIKRRSAVRLQGALDQLEVSLRTQAATDNAHPCLDILAKAVKSQDVAAYSQAFVRRASLSEKKSLFQEYKQSLKHLEAACHDLGRLFAKHRHDPLWRDRAQQLSQAWNWAIARRALRDTADADHAPQLTARFHRLQEQIENSTSELVALRAWSHFFQRLSPWVRQNLVAWRATIQQIGQGTGQNANAHRQTARKYLAECIPAIPAWIMPLHKLWDTVRAAPGLFDTIIIDEASQAGIDALPLLLLGKRIVVVGDDMQNSPEAVGISAANVQRLVGQHLGQFHFAANFNLTTSLFDLAHLKFPSQVTLREHFRCVPEIVRFSDRFYNPPLIPLRQVPAAALRLPSLRTTFVEGGQSEGSNAAIRNDAEADAIVNTIKWMVEDKAYENKTIGVIAMQGRAQAERIARRLTTALSPAVIEERRIRCGESANFQGDQRDVILLSLVVGPNQQYVAQTTLAAQRRYNVAMTRARDQVWLFHSVEPADLSPLDLRHQLLKHFQQPHSNPELHAQLETLRRAAQGPREIGTAPAPFDSWFELDAYLALSDCGFYVSPQVEVAHYRIDLVVEGTTARLAVECDGEHWHGPEQYSVDMARQRQLERAGWTFVRVREAAFYADRESALAAVREACEELGITRWGQQQSDAHSEPGQLLTEDADIDESGNEPADYDVSTEDEDDTEAESPGSDSEGDVPEMRVDGIPFSGYSDADGYPDPREAAPANVRECVAEIIRRDGPLMCSSVYRLYAAACPGFRRCGKSVKAKLNQAIGSLLRSGAILRETELASLPPDSRVVRIATTPKWIVRPAGLRDILEIPPLELIAVLDELLESCDEPGALSELDWATALLERYDGERMTRPREPYLLSVVREWKRKHE